jgi:hypothetical protein
MAWLQLLGIARTRVVDRLCNFESPAADADHQAQVAAASGIGRGEDDHSAAAAAVASLLAVLDRQSVEDVCFERASMGNPACSEDLVEAGKQKDGGSDSDDPDDRQAKKLAHRAAAAGNLDGHGSDTDDSHDDDDGGQPQTPRPAKKIRRARMPRHLTHHAARSADIEAPRRFQSKCFAVQIATTRRLTGRSGRSSSATTIQRSSRPSWPCFPS